MRCSIHITQREFDLFVACALDEAEDGREDRAHMFDTLARKANAATANDAARRARKRLADHSISRGTGKTCRPCLRGRKAHYMPSI